MIYLLETIQLIAVIVLFVLVKRQEKVIKGKDKEIEALQKELDSIKFNISKEEVKLTEDSLKVNGDTLPILLKIKRNYALSKTDKTCLLVFLITFMKNVKTELIFKVSITKKYTYNEACDIIIDYIKRPLYTEDQIKDVLNAIFWLITK